MELDLMDGDAILLVSEEDGAGIHGGMSPLFLHGELYPKKKRFSFSKKRRNFSVKS